MAIAPLLRMAGPKLLGFLKGGMTNKDLAFRLAPDLAFATINAAMTPGNLVEKGVTGVTDFALSGLTGLSAGNLAGRAGASGLAQGLIDQAASIGGGYLSYPVSTNIVRTLDSLSGGPGLTAFEKMAEKEREDYTNQVRIATLQNAGLLPGINPTYLGNSYLEPLGLA